MWQGISQEKAASYIGKLIRSLLLFIVGLAQPARLLLSPGRQNHGGEEQGGRAVFGLVFVRATCFALTHVISDSKDLATVNGKISVCSVCAACGCGQGVCRFPSSSDG